MEGIAIAERRSAFPLVIAIVAFPDVGEFANDLPPIGFGDGDALRTLRLLAHSASGSSGV
ncbi:Uncharacterised protein [Mycobacteroides abscessus subsp. abscessus]|nr:Uncharacterised protein [Mycobacteroides abscessus subsp. abscessus]